MGQQRAEGRGRAPDRPRSRAETQQEASAAGSRNSTKLELARLSQNCRHGRCHAARLAALTLGKPKSVVLGIVLAGLPGGAIMAAVCHAETLAHHSGEPCGTLVPALAVTTSGPR